MDSDELIERSLTFARLEELRPSNEELLRNTRRATMWYNEAPYTAARIIVLAAETDENVRDAFLSQENWRRVMKEECEYLYHDLMDIGLSAFQGGSAEQLARRVLEQ